MHPGRGKNGACMNICRQGLRVGSYDHSNKRSRPTPLSLGMVSGQLIGCRSDAWDLWMVGGSTVFCRDARSAGRQPGCARLPCLRPVCAGTPASAPVARPMVRLRRIPVLQSRPVFDGCSRDAAQVRLAERPPPAASRRAARPRLAHSLFSARDQSFDSLLVHCVVAKRRDSMRDT